MPVITALQTRLNYAQTVRGNTLKQQFTEENIDINNNNNYLVAVAVNSKQQTYKKLEDMQLMGKIDIMLNLLTAVIAKM